MLLAAEEGDKFEAYQGYDCNELRAMSTSLYLHKVTNYYSGFRFLTLLPVLVSLRISYDSRAQAKRKPLGLL